MKDTVIIGAGIVGLTVALRLVLDGVSVCLVDPSEPASGCSHGNAGYLSQANVFPPSSIVGLLDILKMARDPNGPLAVRPGYLPRFLPWAARAVMAKRPARQRGIMDATSALILPAIDSFGPLLEAAGAGDLIERRGALMVCRMEKTLRAKALRIPVLREYGVEVEQVDAGAVADLEPDLARDVAGGIYYPNSVHCLDPRALGTRFARRVAASGGEILRGRVRKMSPTGGGGWQLILDDGVLSAGRVVVCAGVWSRELLRPLGFNVPTEAERGYHYMLPEPSVRLSRPVSMAEAFFVATPMRHGLRLAGTAEFAGIDAPMRPERASGLYRLAKPFLPGLADRGAKAWMGRRPSFPDGLPAIGASPRHHNLFYCFGHNHNGLMQAAISARLVSEIVRGRAPSVALSPYSLDRFSRLLAVGERAG